MNARLILLLIIVTAVCAVNNGVAAEGLRAGVATVETTPKDPVRMSGYASRKGLSTGVHDPLSVRVVAFENAGQRLVMVSTDVIGFYAGTAEDFRSAICRKHKLEAGELFLCGTHTHAVPTLTLEKKEGYASNFEYTRELRRTILNMVGEALEELKPARLGIGSGSCPIGSNRRQLVFNRDPNGEIRLGRNPYGVTDKEVLVLKVAEQGGETAAVIFDYATHGTSLGGKNYTISGDVLGLAEQFVEKIYGGKLIAPAFAGASGNIDPWFRVLPQFDQREGWVPEPVLLGTFLGEEVVHVCEGIKADQSEAAIASAFVTLDLPGKQSDEEEEDAEAESPTLNLTVARLGEVGFVGLGAEVLTEIGMAIKEGSPYEHTFVITHCNGAAGYLAPKELYVEGGYEISSSRFGPEASQIVVRKAVELLHELR